MLDHLRPKPSATWPVVLLPANGSITNCPGDVRKRMKKSGSSGGKRAGWIGNPAARHLNRYWSYERVFGTVNTLGGIAPPLSRWKCGPISCCDGLIAG